MPHAPLVAAERDTYETAWALDGYANFAPGEQYLPLFLEIAKPEQVQSYPGLGRVTRQTTVLDAGIGSGKGALALVAAGFAVTGCDLTPDGLVPEAQGLPFVDACLWHDLRAAVGPFDYVYCCDVLEHIPPEWTMLVIQRLLEVAQKGVFFSISLVPDSFGVWVGKPLHQSVYSFQWWRDHLADLGTLVECRHLLHTGIFYVKPHE